MEKKLLNVGVIGLGMGKVHAEGVKKMGPVAQRVGDVNRDANTAEQMYQGACLYAVCDTDAARANTVAQELDVAHVFTDYRDLIADPAIDAVIIASPDQDHREMVVNTLNAGKHVLCEKPLALTREDCEVIVEAVKTVSYTHLDVYKRQVVSCIGLSITTIFLPYFSSLTRKFSRILI